MSTAARQSPRPYLSAALRRDQLLAVAGRMVRTGGWTSLSMQGLAAAAGVSRQLVYEHFATAEELHLATLTALFERSYATAEAITRSAGSTSVVVRAAVTQLLDLPAEERHALRSLGAEPEPGRRGVAHAHRRLRSRIASLWVPFIRLRTGVGEPEASALAWMLTTAAWSLTDSISDGALDRDAALDLFVRFVDGAIGAWAAPSVAEDEPPQVRAASLRRRPAATRDSKSREGRTPR